MAASYFMLKMLKKKPKKKSQTRSVKTKSETDKFCSSDHDKSFVKCRICLNEGSISIFGKKLTFDLPEAIQTIGGVEVHESDPYPKYLCDNCYSLLNGAVLFRKVAQESNNILRQVPTTVADTSTHSDYNYTDDYESEELTSYKCKTCKLEFKTLEQYTIHKHTKKHKNVRIQCQMCPRLLTPQLYEKHVARHQSATHLVCDVCGKLYRKDNLVRHLQLHSNDLPFQCQICPYRGRFVESLKIHMRTHSGDKPFSCDKCELRFVTRSNLNRHLLTHKKEKPFKCLECSRGFYTQRDMDVHLKADHAGIKEFSCRMCGNKYGTKKALMRHELRVHKRDKMAKGRMPLYLQPEYRN